jgi:hypothetical protein
VTSAASAFAGRRGHGAFLLNRMLIGVAADVKRFIAQLHGLEPVEIDGPDELLGVPKPMLLAIGWRHLLSDGRERFGADVLLRAARAAPPDLPVFVVPDRLTAGRYGRERAAFDEAVGEGFTVWVLELARLRELGPDVAATRARENVLALDGAVGVHLLLGAASTTELER